MLQELLHSAPRCEPLIRIYPHYLSFNAAAANLLGIGEGDSISVMMDDRDGYIYVAKCACMRQSYSIRMKKTLVVVSSAPLCRKMASLLEGFGTYKICRNEMQEFMGHTFYNIFKKKYGKDC